MNRSLALLAAFTLIGGCQSFTPDASGTPPVEDAQAPAPAAPARYGSFSEESLYSLLAAELAGQRNRFDIALGNYVQQANATQDPGVAERAFRIAEYLGAEQAALDTSLIWARNAPDNLDAQRAAAIQLARGGRYDDSMLYMEKVLKGQGDTHFDFLALSAADTDPDTRAGLLESFDRLLTRYPGNGQLLFGKALLLQQDDRPREALQLLEDHPAEDHDIAPLLLRVRLLQSLERGDEGLPLLEKGLRRHPDDKRVRLAYARLLVELERMDDARDQFTELVQRFPDDDDLRFSLALVSMEAEAWDDAEIYLQQLIQRNSHVDAAHFNLGRVHEAQQRPEQALDEYAQVTPGNDYLPAQLRRSEILFSLGRGEEAAELLEGARQSQPDYAIQLYLIESESWAQSGNLERAWQVLQQGLEQFPDDLGLLYSRAMLAEQRGQPEQLERDLRFIIEREPDNTMALNALGYTLADRNERLDEARRLIERAYQFNADDAAILDSMGWVAYRQGDLPRAEHYLRKALQQSQDAEIAAHLGEVLWIQGKQADAKKVWSAAQKSQPDSSILRDTLLRLTGSETL